MKRGFKTVFLTVLCTLAGACTMSSSSVTPAAPKPLNMAITELPEDRVMDVWIEQFTPSKVDEDEAEETGVSDDIRRAESRFIPVHLRDTMQSSGYWGVVRVVPRGTVGAELLVSGTVIQSNGRELVLDVTARDAMGTLWLERTYSTWAVPVSYDGTAPGEQDAFQNVYNQISNDLAEILMQQPAAEVESVRQAAALRFAADMAPSAFEDYLSEDARGGVMIERLPSEDDPLYTRVLALKDRDDMFADVLNAHYGQFYNGMWDSYTNWRRASLEEILALEEVERESSMKIATGVLAILGAIAIDSFGGSNNTGTLEAVMVGGGAMAIQAGINQGAEAEMHEVAIQELGQSFEAEVSPMVVEIDGETIELTGSADVQYMRWRQLLQRRHIAETGATITVVATNAPDGGQTCATNAEDAQVDAVVAAAAGC